MEAPKRLVVAHSLQWLEQKEEASDLLMDHTRTEDSLDGGCSDLEGLECSRPYYWADSLTAAHFVA